MEPDELDPLDDDEFDETDDERNRARSRRLARLGRRLLDRGGELGKGVLETSDRAKTEAVRMIAREVRHYLDELRLKEDLLDLATSHSLEVSVSLSLKPLAHAVDAQKREEPRSEEVPAAPPTTMEVPQEELVDPDLDEDGDEG